MEDFNREGIPSPLENPAQVEKNSLAGMLRFLIDVLETLILSVVLFVGINAVTARVRVDGTSMEPTLHNGELILVNKLAYRFSQPTRGDVIVFYFPRDPEQEYIKRLVGLPGDKVRVDNGKMYVNDQLVDEPYIAAAPNYPGEWVVPAGQFFVLGDNRNNSYDSHNWGSVPGEYVVGKAVFIYWPFERLGIIEHIALAGPIPQLLVLRD